MSTAYRVVVGDRTLVKKVIVGTPLDTVVIGPYADIDNIIGVDTSAKADGAIFAYDSASGNWIASDNPFLEVDGKFYPSDSVHTNILIRRSGTQGEPIYLQQGELAYSFLSDTATDGFGNGGDRLYIATGENNDSGYSTNIDIIGGKYFTDLLNHQQGTLTKNSAILVDSDRKIDLLLADSASMAILRVTEEGIIQRVRTNRIQLPTGSTSLFLLDNQGNSLIEADSGDGVVLYWNGTPQLRTDDGSINVLNNLDVSGITTLDSTTIDGNLLVTGDVVVQGETTNLSTTQLLIEDKQIVIGDNTPYNSPEFAHNAGIALGDSAFPIAFMRYKNDPISPVSRDSAYWEFYPGIKASRLEVPVLEFEVIDCGTYA